MTNPPEPAPIALFDGVCNLCHGAVQFILDHESRPVLRFASIQSPIVTELLAPFGRKPPPGDPESMMLIENGKLYEHSTAVLRIARIMGGIWQIFAILLLVPAFIRDPLYRFVARNRYRWFGRADQCRIPTPALRARIVG